MKSYTDLEKEISMLRQVIVSQEKSIKDLELAIGDLHNDSDAKDLLLLAFFNRLQSDKDFFERMKKDKHADTLIDDIKKVCKASHKNLDSTNNLLKRIEDTRVNFMPITNGGR